MASLCTVWFPFCVCLKRLANRKFSVSTCDSQYNRRFSTVRKGPVESIYRPAGAGSGGASRVPGGVCVNGDALGYRNGGKMYIELRRGLLARERSALSMNDFYRDSLERGVGKKGVHFSSNRDIRQINNNHHHLNHITNKVVDKSPGKNSNGRSGIMKNSHSSNSIFREPPRREQQQQQHANFTTRPTRRLPAFLRSESGDSTKRLTSNRSHESDLGDIRFTAPSPGHGGDVTPQSSSGQVSPTTSPDSVALNEFLFLKPASNGSATKLKCLPEDDCSQVDCNAF